MNEPQGRAVYSRIAQNAKEAGAVRAPGTLPLPGSACCLVGSV